MPLCLCLGLALALEVIVRDTLRPCPTVPVHRWRPNRPSWPGASGLEELLEGPELAQRGRAARSKGEGDRQTDKLKRGSWAAPQHCTPELPARGCSRRDRRGYIPRPSWKGAGGLCPHSRLHGECEGTCFPRRPPSLSPACQHLLPSLGVPGCRPPQGGAGVGLQLVVGAQPLPAPLQPPAQGRILDTMPKTIAGAAWASREETGRPAMCSGLGGCGGWRGTAAGGLAHYPRRDSARGATQAWGWQEHGGMRSPRGCEATAPAPGLTITAGPAAGEYHLAGTTYPLPGAVPPLPHVGPRPSRADEG